MVLFRIDEDLGFVLEPAEGLGVEHPVTVALRETIRRFAIREGGRTVGAGTVTEVIQ